MLEVKDNQDNTKSQNPVYNTPMILPGIVEEELSTKRAVTDEFTRSVGAVRNENEGEKLKGKSYEAGSEDYGR